MAKKIRKIWFLIPLALAACSAPSVNLATPEPIKVDIDMRLDVYQHADPNAVAVAAAAASKPKPAPAATPSSAQDPAVRQKNRAAEIQNFKNSRWVGEGREGLLVIRQPLPDGDAGDYIAKVVQQENVDRNRLMREQADAQKKPLAEIQAQAAAEWRNRSFSGEFIEVQQPDGAYKLVQKEG
ncbi:MAG TPA: DUF1318 domain-containing protein [Chthoniobacterales bacterium]